MLKTEIAEVMQDTGKVYAIAEKTNYRLTMSGEEREAAEVLDAWAKSVGKTGSDPDKEIAAFVTRTVEEELYNAPDELLDAMFDRGTVGEFDDYQANTVAKNTLIAHEAARGGNVTRSYLNFDSLKPTWKNLQVETDLSYVDMRKSGWKSVATLTTYMKEALQNKMFAIVLGAVDAAIVGGDQLISAQGVYPSMEDMDALTLYLNEYADGGVPMTVSLMKYCSKLRRMTGYAEFMSDAMKDDFNRYGFAKLYDGVAITGISSAKKLGDGGLLIPDKRIFGIAGKIGSLDMKGEIHTYENTDDNAERIHLMVKDFTFGYSISHIERVAKIVLE